MNPAAWTLLLDLALRLSFAAIIIARSRSSPAVRWAWLIVVLAVPLIGVGLYLLFGEIWHDRGRLARHRRVIAQVRAQLAEGTEEESAKELERGGRISSLIRGLEGFPVRPGNRLELFGDSAEGAAALRRDIDRARESCHLLFYIYLDDGTGTAVGEALIRAAQRGVHCRLLVDALGSAAFLGSSLCRRLRQGGVEVEAALSLGFAARLGVRADHRNHRKIAVIDGTVGWTGSQNLADAAFAVKAKFAPWVDVLVRMRGPAVADLQTVFVEDWLLEREEEPAAFLTPPPEPEPDGVPVQVLGTGPTGDYHLVRQLVLLGLLEAHREMILTTPYFVPDESTATALCAAARSGVRTVLIVPRRNDSRLVAAASRSFYDELLSAGVELYEFHRGLLHAKTVTIDEQMALVATANMDRRSFELNYEVNLLVFDPEFTGKLRAVQQGYLDQSAPVSLEAWRTRPLVSRFLEKSASMLAPLL